MNLADYLPSYFSSDSEMNIDENSNNLIFAPNGTGKTSIYNKLTSNENAHFLDYEKMLVSFKKSKKSISISTNINAIEELESEVQSLRESMNVTNSLKLFSIRSITNCPSFLENIYTDKYVETTILLSQDKFNRIEVVWRILGSNFIKVINAQTFNQISDLNFELDKLAEEYKEKTINEIDKFVSNDEIICPLCGSEVENLKNRILEIKNRIVTEEIYNLKILNDFNLSQTDCENIVNIFQECNDDDLKDFLCMGADFTNKEIINNNINTVNIKLDEINGLREEQRINYENIRTYNEIIKNTFINKYVDSEIVFNDENFSIDIQFPRDVSKYSTGELNFILFNIKIYEFFGSEKRYLYIDDVLTSYDKSNQYTLIYLLCKIFSDHNEKKFTCFTHNFDTLRIANNQNRIVTKDYILDRVNKKLFLEELDVKNLEKLFNGVENNRFDYEYINLLIERNVEDLEDPIHQLFHYDETYSHEDFSNEELFDNINNFELENIIDYSSIIEFKIAMFISLRVFIEKKIFENISEIQKNDIKGKKFGEKINYIFPSGQGLSVLGFNRDILFSKKVMINDSMHTENRMMVIFDYILNISLSDLVQEINHIKSLSEEN